MATGIFLVSGRRYPHLFHPIHHGIITHMGTEIQFAFRFDKMHMTLALRDALRTLLAANLREIAAMADLTRPRVERIHLATRVDGSRAKHIIYLPVAGHIDGVIGIMSDIES